MKTGGLKKAIEAAGSVSKLAERLGVTRQTIYNWDNVPAEAVLDLEADYNIPRSVLRPDLYPPERECGHTQTS